MAGIRFVEANVLTGSLLVIYAPHWSVEVVAQLIAEQLARISHHPPAAARDLPASTALRSGRVLNVVSATPPRPTCRAPCSHGHLPCLATACGEKCGLGAASPSSEGLTPSQIDQPPLRHGPDLLLSPGAPSQASAMPVGFTALPEAFPITPALFSVPLGFLRTFSIGLLHASPILLFLTLLIVLMGQIVGKEEGWSKADALYFSFITASTVGYGDLRPTTPLSKVLAVSIGFVGVIFTGIVTAIGLHAAQSAFAKLRSAELTQ